MISTKKCILFIFVIILICIVAFSFYYRAFCTKKDIGLGYVDICSPKILGFIKDNTQVRFSFYSIDCIDDQKIVLFISSFEESMISLGFKKVKESYLIPNSGEQFSIYVFSGFGGIDCRGFRQCADNPLIEMDMSVYNLDPALMANLTKEKCSNNSY